MKNSRGFISAIVAVIASVLAVLAVGGWILYQANATPENRYATSSQGQAEDKRIGGMTFIGSVADQFKYEKKRYPKDMAELKAEFEQNSLWREKRSEGNPPKWSDYTYVGVDGGISYVLRTTINPESKLFPMLKDLPQRRDGTQAGLDCQVANGYICFVPFN